MIFTNIEKWGVTKNNEQIYRYILKNEFLEVGILNYGGVIQKILTPDKNGKFENIVLGFDSITEYERYANCSPHFGAIVGRNAGRIKEGKLIINGELYQLGINNGNNNLHGFPDFYGQKIWSGEIKEEGERAILTLKRTSPHLESNFPGNVEFTVKYILEKNSLTLEYTGIPDRDTYINLTNHTYFNLSGNYKRDIGNQNIKLFCNKYLEVNEETLPIRISDVENTIFDLRKGRKFNEVFNSSDKQVEIVNNGFDHPFVFSESENEKINGECYDEESGRNLKLITNQPVVVVYTGNYLSDIEKVSGNVKGKNHLGFCLETQDYPDVLKFIPEKAHLYNSNKKYYQKTTFVFNDFVKK